MTACLAAALPLFAEENPAAHDDWETLNAPPGIELRDAQNRPISRVGLRRELGTRLSRARPKNPWLDALDDLRLPTCILKPQELFFAAGEHWAWLGRPSKLGAPRGPPLPALFLACAIFLCSALWSRPLPRSMALVLRC